MIQLDGLVGGLVHENLILAATANRSGRLIFGLGILVFDFQFYRFKYHLDIYKIWFSVGSKIEKKKLNIQLSSSSVLLMTNLYNIGNVSFFSVTRVNVFNIKYLNILRA